MEVERVDVLEKQGYVLRHNAWESNGEIMIPYRYEDIGSGKPPPEELADYEARRDPAAEPWEFHVKHLAEGQGDP